MHSRVWGLNIDLSLIFIQIFAFLALKGLHSGCEGRNLQVVVLHDAPEPLKGARNIFINGPKAVKLGVNRLGPLFSHETTYYMMVAYPLLHMVFIFTLLRTHLKLLSRVVKKSLIASPMQQKHTSKCIFIIS